MAVASPSLILLTSQNYLRASAAGVNLDGGSALSVVVTFDPYLIGADQDGTIISKHNPGATQFGWKLSYDAVTNFVTATIYSSAAGTTSISRVSTVAITRRSVVAFTFNLIPGDLHLYTNGVPTDGVQTGTITTIAANTERLSLFADSTGNTPQNVAKGGIYHAAIWRTTLTAGEVASVLPDGITPPALISGYNLVANFPASRITQSIDGHLSDWVDTVASLTLLGFAVTGDTPRCNLQNTGLVLTTNKWDYTLADTGFPGALGLTSTYTTLVPFRLWGAALTEPQRASNFRQTMSDVTILCRARKVVGTTQAIFIRLRGLVLQYNLASKELFAIVGDDTTATNQNTRVSFGFNIFPIEGITADIVLRFNAVDKTVDAFIGDTKYVGTVVVTNANETATGLFFATGSDFVLASVVPACLSDAGVALLIAGNLSSVFSMGFNLVPNGYTQSLYLIDAADLAEVPLFLSDAFPFIQDRQYSSLPALIRFGYTGIPYPVVDSARNLFIDPFPVITSLTVNGAHEITGIGTAGPTDAYNTFSYWEIELATGVSVIIIDSVSSTQFFASRANSTTYWDVPEGSLWNGLRVRFVVQAVSDSGQIWYSAWQTLNDPNYDFLANTDSSIGIYFDPLSSIQAVTVDSMHLVTAVAMSGPILPAGSTHTLHYWEVEMDSGAVFSSCAATVDGVIRLERVQIIDSFKVPLGEVWNCRRIRFAVRIEDFKKRHYPQVFYSAWHLLKDPNFDNAGLPPAVVPVWPGAVTPVSDNPIVPPLTIDLFDVEDYTFHERSILYPIGTLINHSMIVEPNIAEPQFFNSSADFPPGLYTITYVAGSRQNLTTSRWNDFFQGNFGTGSRGMWIQSGINFPYYVFQNPAFIPVGYTSQALAQAAAVNYSFIFYHIGGPLGIIFDLDGVNNSGSITVALNDTQGVSIPGEWQVVSQPAESNVSFVDNQQQYPTIKGLARGQTHLRYIVKGLDNKARWQDTYVRVWPSPTAAADLAQRLDPNAPSKPIPVDVTGSAKLIHPRNAIVLPPPTSGNKA